MPPKPQTVHPAPIRDVARAVLEVKRHAEEWNVDPDHVLVAGFSAGAHNAALYSACWNEPVIRDFFDATEEELRPAGCIAGYPVVDYTFMGEGLAEAEPMCRAFFEASNVAFFGTSEPTPEQLASASVNLHVDASTPPMFLWATADDSMVPVRHTLRLADALSAHGVPFELHIFERGDHGLSIGTPASAVIQPRVSPEVARWTAFARDWMFRNHPVNLPEVYDPSMA